MPKIWTDDYSVCSQHQGSGKAPPIGNSPGCAQEAIRTSGRDQVGDLWYKRERRTALAMASRLGSLSNDHIRTAGKRVLGNIGREGVGVNPMRGQNNVQGSCDMGSFPHEFPGYRSVADPQIRGIFEKEWSIKLASEPGLRLPNMFDGATDGSFRRLFIRGEDLSQIPTRITSSTLCVRWTLSSCRTCSSTKQRHLPTSSFPGPTAVFAGTSRNISYREAIFSYSNPNSRTLASSIPLSIEVIISLALRALTSLESVHALR